MSTFEIIGDIVRITLTKSQVAIIDLSDYDSVKDFSWYAAKARNGDFYAIRSYKKKGRKNMVPLHRQLMGGSKLLVVDHINRDSLDNRRSNLRLCTNSQNIQNQKPRIGYTSTYQGVSLHKPTKKWQALIKKNDKRSYLGLFVNEIDAAKAYDIAAFVEYGRHARMNMGETL